MPCFIYAKDQKAFYERRKAFYQKYKAKGLTSRKIDSLWYRKNGY